LGNFVGFLATPFIFFEYNHINLMMSLRKKTLLIIGLTVVGLIVLLFVSSRIILGGGYSILKGSNFAVELSENFYYLILILLGISLVYGTIIYFIIEKLILSRLHRLRENISQVAAAGDVVPHVALSGRDELSQLADEMNLTFEALQKSDQALKVSEERFHNLFKALPVAVVELDLSAVKSYIDELKSRPDVNPVQYFRNNEEELAKGMSLIRLLAVNEETIHLLDFESEEDLYNWVVKNGCELRTSDFNEVIYGIVYMISEGESSFQSETTLRTCQAKLRQVYIQANIVSGHDQDYSRCIITCVDITEQKKAEDALRESEERYALAVQGANDGIWDWDLRNDQIYFSPRWKNLLGYMDKEISTSPDEWLGRVHPDDIEQLKAEIKAHLEGKTQSFKSEHRVYHKNGSYRWVQVRGLAVSEGDQEPHRMAGSMTDINARKVTEEYLRHDAMHDPLTGLPNRIYMMDQLRRSIERAKRHSDYQAAVLFLDLDRFKIINDSLGHLSGDKMLVIIGQRVLAAVRPEDTVARFGGDEFMVLLEDIKGVNDATRIAQRIQDDLAQAIDLHGHEVFTTVSIGIAMTATGYDRMEDLLRDAETAMYRAKADGRARHQIFDAAMHARSLTVLRLETELRRALEREEFQVNYQPIISLRSGKIVAVEALLRWYHPERGLILPSDFITLAEETGLIVPIDEWVLRQSCRQAKEWQARGHADLAVAVNISARHLQDESLPGVVKQVLQETGIPGNRLHLEVTESAAMSDFGQSITALKELDSLGIKISIDDFSTSYSSLGYLKRFPVNSIKIDQSFVKDLMENPDDAAITTAIIAMGHILNLSVIAEGVRTEEQLDFLMHQDCDEIQGHLISKAVPPVEIDAMLDADHNLLAGHLATKQTV
jgi:diguanylate cyclase (GGDEF)-like protein/PAS domain S-box-containing protein